MKQMIMSKLFRKVLILCFLCTGVVFLTFGDKVQTVLADVCCDDCYQYELQCEEYWKEWGYTSVHACNLDTGVYMCYQQCNYDACP